MLTYQIDMCFIVIIEHGQNLLEVGQNFIVPCHICSKNGSDHSLSDLLEIVTIEGFEDIAVVILQNSEGHAAMMVLQRRYVVVANG